MTKPEILLKMAKIRLAYAKQGLARTRELMKHVAEAEAACEQDQLNVDLAQCEVELAELDVVSKK